MSLQILCLYLSTWSPLNLFSLTCLCCFHPMPPLIPCFGWIPLYWLFSQISVWTFLSTSFLPVTSQTIHLFKKMQLKLCTHLGLFEHYIPVCNWILINLLDWTGELIMGCDVLWHLTRRVWHTHLQDRNIPIARIRQVKTLGHHYLLK